MDICAVANAPEEVLERMGLTKVGDRLNLIAYCKNLEENDGTTLAQEEAKTKKRALLEAFLSKTKVTKASKISKSNKKSSLFWRA